ncbi:hypothetical protein FYJ88_07595 [Corynebacterium urealyticum]|nr:hypothetical protein FYJ88_07595 [Corynebacterium urealyticum]
MPCPPRSALPCPALPPARLCPLPGSAPPCPALPPCPAPFGPLPMRFAELSVAFWLFSGIKLCKT